MKYIPAVCAALSALSFAASARAAETPVNVQDKAMTSLTDEQARAAIAPLV
jgi:hypothetical protein